MSERATEQVIDVSELPTYVHGHRGVIWWGTAGMIAIEGTVFVLTGFAYLYIRAQLDTWPPSVEPPSLLWGTINLAIALVSLVPNQLAKRAAENEDRQKVRLWILVCVLFGLVLLIVRIFEFRSLNVAWDTNAYGSAAWMLLGLHTVHLLTDFYDTAVLTALAYIGPWEGKRFVDIGENAMYWYFVVLAWLPIYGLLYWAPRLL